MYGFEIRCALAPTQIFYLEYVLVLSVTCFVLNRQKGLFGFVWICFPSKKGDEGVIRSMNRFWPGSENMYLI